MSDEFDPVNEDDHQPEPGEGADEPTDAPAPVDTGRTKQGGAKRKRAGFDESKPYATVHGGLTQARYLQDGKYYNAAKKPCKGPE